MPYNLDNQRVYERKLIIKKFGLMLGLMLDGQKIIQLHSQLCTMKIRGTSHEENMNNQHKKFAKLDLFRIF